MSLVLTALSCGAVAQEKIGRLFFTPEQRIRLEQLESKPEGETAVIISDKILVNGIVQRNGGSRVVWINGVPQSQKGTNGILVERDITPDSVPVKIPGTGNLVRLKVGQSIDLNSSVNRSIVSEQEFKSAQQSAQKTGKKSILPSRKMD
ncbi:MAG: hypothetical protein KAI88_02270 [Nitrosomonadaceae bacterium]|nr:hypothetical protein [Nitrosomonadaceae bacterium]